MNDFEEYIRQSEPHKREKGYAWQTAIGLQAVDGLKPSEYLKEKARQHIEGDITIDEVKQLVDSYYKSKVARSSSEDRTEEADKVSARITEILWRIHSHSHLSNTWLFIGIYLKAYSAMPDKYGITILQRMNGY